jgi:hypothetical protein
MAHHVESFALGRQHVAFLLPGLLEEIRDMLCTIEVRLFGTQ